MPIRIAFDIGGVLSKYPDLLRPMFKALRASPDFEVFVMTDMHSPEQSMQMLKDNGFEIDPEHLINTDFTTHGEACKAVEQERLGIDIMMDDFPGYVAEGAPLRLLVWPDIRRPYYHDSWKVNDPGVGNFGRRFRRGVTVLESLQDPK